MSISSIEFVLVHVGLVRHECPIGGDGRVAVAVFQLQLALERLQCRGGRVVGGEQVQKPLPGGVRDTKEPQLRLVLGRVVVALLILPYTQIICSIRLL